MGPVEVRRLRTISASSRFSVIDDPKGTDMAAQTALTTNPKIPSPSGKGRTLDRKRSHEHLNLVVRLDSAYRRSVHLVSETGAGEMLEAAIHPDNRGRKGNITAATFLALQLTGIQIFGSATLKAMSTVAHTLPFHTAKEFGLIRVNRDGQFDDAVNYDALSRKAKTIDKNLSGTYMELTETQINNLGPDGIAAEGARRAQVLADIVDALITGSRHVQTDHGTYAVDDTGIWAWERANLPTGSRLGGAERPIEDEDVRAPRTFNDARVPHAPDAAFSAKTSKSGATETMFGYKGHVIVNTNDPSGKKDLPILIHALEVTPANVDIVDVTLGLIDRVRSRSLFHTIIGDRHYSYKKMSRWAMALWSRQIQQVLDFRSDAPQAVTREGALIIDGGVFCPGTPRTLRTLEHPSTFAQTTAAAKTTAPTTSRNLFDARQSYALRIVTQPTASPKAITEGTAHAGCGGPPRAVPGAGWQGGMPDPG